MTLKTKAIEKKAQVKHLALESDFLKIDNKYNAGLHFQRAYTALANDIIAEKAKELSADMPDDAAPTIIALGGYGRGELAPFSDIDIVFVHPAPFNRYTKKFIEKLSSRLWNAGLRISASTRSLDDCAKAMDQDLSFLTSLLEMRLVWGKKGIFRALEKTFRAHLKKTPPGWFVVAKLEERDLRHHKTGDSRYCLQPDIKEGKGALRDIHTLLWLTNFVYDARTPADLLKKKLLTAEEAGTLEKAQQFYWTARCHMHLLAGRACDRLSFELQPDVARRMGYKNAAPNRRAEDFMKDYFLRTREVGHLTRLICTKIEAQSLKGEKLVLDADIEGFPIKGNRLTVARLSTFKKTPAEIVRLFAVSQAFDIGIHPDALRYMRRALPALARARKKALPHLLTILLSPVRAEQTLRHMNEADVLSTLIPAFENIVAHMQYDMYHAFTADEHTLHAIGTLHKLETGALAADAPLATALFPTIHRRRALYAAMLLHDVAKGTGEAHAAAGAKIARETAPSLGLDAAETEAAAWLVEHHLTMTLTAFKRDFNDPKTIADFAAIVQTPERLKLLTLLTTADIIAVGPGRWNSWKAGLLAELYNRTLDMLSDTRPAQQQQSKPPSSRRTRIKIVRRPEQDHTQVTVTTPDRKGLFAQLAGAMAAAGVSIVEARIFTFSNGMAEDRFHIQTSAGYAVENTDFLEETLKAALDGTLDIAKEIRARRKTAPGKAAPFNTPPRVVTDNAASDSDTVIEVTGHDRPGFLYAIAAALLEQDLQISAAKVTTFGSRAVDVLYVRNGFGLKILHPTRLETIEKALESAILSP